MVGKFSPNSSSEDLLGFFVTKFELIVFKDKLNNSSLGMVLSYLLPKTSLSALKPTLCDILGYEPTTSAVTKMHSRVLNPDY